MNKKNSIFVLAFLVFASAQLLYSQVIIKGTVVDQQTRRPLSGAIVVANETHATTNEEGRFTLTSDRTIESITIQLIGYERKEAQITDPSQPLTIELVQSAVQLTGIQILANRQLTQAQSIGALTPQDLSRTNGLSLENSINAVPGLFMQSRTPWGGARITIRGYYPSTSGNSPNSNGLGYQLFLNNIPVTDATGTTVMDDIDFSTLGNVEVIKGPSSSLYGSFIAGTINLSTAKPVPNQTTIEQDATGGSHGLFRSNTSLQSSGDFSDVVLNYGHQTYDSFRPHSASKKDYARFTGDFHAGPDQTVSAYFSYNRSAEELAGEIDSADFYARNAVSHPLYLANDSHIQTKSFLTGITNSYRWNENFSNQTTVFGSGRASSQPFAHGFTDVNQFNFGARTMFGYATQCGEVGINGALGGMLHRSTLTSNGVFIVPAPPFAQRPSDQENYAMNYYAFTEWNVDLPMQFTVTLGASLNRNEFGIRNMLKNNAVNDTTLLVVKVFKPTFTPRISVLKMFGDNVSVYASVSSGYAPPLLSDAIASNGTIDLDLKPERSTQFEIGTKGNLLEQKLSYQLALFDLENTDKLVRQTANSVTFTTNAGKQRNRGVEVSLSYLAIDDAEAPISLVRPWVSYTYSDFKYVDFKSDNNNNASTVDFSGKAVARVPRNMFNIGLDAGSNVGVYLHGTYQYVDKAPITFDNTNYVRSYSLLSAKIGIQRQLGDRFLLDVSAGGDNLLGKTYYAFVFVGPNFKGLAQAQDGGTGDGYIIPAPYKATFYAGARLSYNL